MPLHGQVLPQVSAGAQVLLSCLYRIVIDAPRDGRHILAGIQSTTSAPKQESPAAAKQDLPTASSRQVQAGRGCAALWCTLQLNWCLQQTHIAIILHTANIHTCKRAVQCQPGKHFVSPLQVCSKHLHAVAVTCTVAACTAVSRLPKLSLQQLPQQQSAIQQQQQQPLQQLPTQRQQ